MRLGIALATLFAVSGRDLQNLQVGTVQAATVPSGLPSHFGIGLSAEPSDVDTGGWLPSSGIPWDYAYTYLSGGVNTKPGNGWQDWNTSGQYPLYYAKSANSHGYIPVFPYYELLQSTGSCDSCGEAQKDLSNLNNTALMAGYYANFRLLMQRLGAGTYGGIPGFGKTAIVQVEPDLSGYAEQAVLSTNQNCYGHCSAQGNNPSYLSASVASSGDADVQSYPNTYQGFNWALLHLRDLYAPNVLLAFHVSDWATMQDVGSSTDPSLNVTSLGQEAGSFAAQSGTSSVPSGVHPYDLVFNDVSDRDAGYYKYVSNDPNAFWDQWNQTLPNFHRWESYVSAVSGAAGRSIMVWQIPEGNQYFDTENNTSGHYQDNRAEYFFAHIPELVQSGIIGLLFGAGNGGSTVQTDAMKDGITNPPSFCTNDGSSNGQVCNNHTSTVSDDDGGYLRLQGQQYFASGGYALGIPSRLNLSVPATATAGSSFSITVTATDSSGTTASSYRGTVHFASSDGQAVLPANYTFTSSDAGSHAFSLTLGTAGPQTVTVTDTSNGALSKATGITVNPGAVARFHLTAPATTTAGTPFSLTMTATDSSGNTITGYTGTVHLSSSDPQAVLPANYTFTAADQGTHSVNVTVKTAGSQTVTVTDSGNGSITGSTSIGVSPAATTTLVLRAPGSVTSGTPFSVRVTAQDAYGNTTPSYAGTVRWSSSDGQASLPAPSTFSNSDGGVHVFTLTLQTAGSQTVTVTDTSTSSLTATAPVLVGVSVPVPDAASAGWNLVGGSPLTVWSDAQAAWSWNALAGQWTSLTSTSPRQPQGSGAWEELGTGKTETVSAQICSAPVSVVVLAHRWNLVGNPCSSTVQLPAGTHALTWTGTSYALTTSIAPGAAAWVVPPSGLLLLNSS